MRPRSAPTAESKPQLASWLSRCLDRDLDARGLNITAPNDGGWSNETWIVDTGLDAPSRVVVRLEPRHAAMFDTYDLGDQVACLALLDRHPEIPTPALLGSDLDGTELGRPAFVMEHVDGKVPRDDKPTFVEAGWLHEAGAPAQRQFHTSLLDALVAIHRITPAADDGIAGVAEPDSNRAAVDELRRVWDYDPGANRSSTIHTVLDELDADAPTSAADVLLWGDARPANVVTDPTTFTPAALLDWELATTGNPARDVIWLLEMNRMRAQGSGLDPLPGFLTDDESIDYFECASGTPLRAADWYRRFAAVRVAVLMHRFLRVQVHAGHLDAGHRVFSDNVSLRRIDELTR